MRAPQVLLSPSPAAIMLGLHSCVPMEQHAHGVWESRNDMTSKITISTIA